MDINTWFVLNMQGATNGCQKTPLPTLPSSKAGGSVGLPTRIRTTALRIQPLQFNPGRSRSRFQHPSVFSVVSHHCRIASFKQPSRLASIDGPVQLPISSRFFDSISPLLALLRLAPYSPCSVFFGGANVTPRYSLV